MVTDHLLRAWVREVRDHHGCAPRADHRSQAGGPLVHLWPSYPALLSADAALCRLHAVGACPHAAAVAGERKAATWGMNARRD